MTPVARNRRVRKTLLEANVVPRGVGREAGDEAILEMESREDPRAGDHEAPDGVTSKMIFPKVLQRAGRVAAEEFILGMKSHESLQAEDHEAPDEVT